MVARVTTREPVLKRHWVDLYCHVIMQHHYLTLIFMQKHNHVNYCGVHELINSQAYSITYDSIKLIQATN